MKRLALLSVFLALPALPQGYSGSSFSGTTTNIVGTTSVCSVGPQGTANGVCLVSGGIDGEGATANAFEATLAFGDSTADATATLTGRASGAGLLMGDGLVSTPGYAFASATGTGVGRNHNGFAELDFTIAGAQKAALYSTGLHLSNASQLYFGNTSSDTNAGMVWLSTGVIKVTDGSTGGGNLVIGTGILTASTMTAETTAQARTVTSSYTWTNAQVAALAGTAGDINVVTLPAKTRLLNAYVVITGAAVGPTTVTVSLGDAIGGTPFINYVVASDAKAAANTVYGDAVAERGANIDVEWYYLPSYTATTLVTAHFISTGANLSTVTGSTGRVVLETEIIP